MAILASWLLCTESIESRGDIHGSTYNSVVEPVFTAEVSDSAEPRMDPHSNLQGPLDFGLSLDILQLEHALTHGDGHLDAGGCVLAVGCRVSTIDLRGQTELIV